VTITVLDHTADVGVEIRSPTRDALFAEALTAFTDIVTPAAGVGEGVERRFELDASEAPELLVAWLEELLFAFEVEELLFARAEVRIFDREGGGLRLEAVARGEPYDPDRHPVKVLIKGVTFHHLEARQEAGGSWLGRVIFDI
jgi:SHS2 domain-containing protein